MSSLKIALLMCAMILLLSAPGCDRSNLSKIETEKVETEFISSSYALMTVELKNSNCAILKIENCSTIEFDYDLTIQLNLKCNDAWYNIPCIQESFEDIAYGVLPDTDSSYELILDDWFGPLSSGYYRIIKPIYGFSSQEFVIAEFMIE